MKQDFYIQYNILLLSPRGFSELIYNLLDLNNL